MALLVLVVILSSFVAVEDATPKLGPLLSWRLWNVFIAHR